MSQSELTETTTDNEETLNASIEVSGSDEAHEQINDFIDTILANADADTTKDELIEYMSASASTSFRRYSQNNKILLFRQVQARDNIESVHHWAGYRTWQNEHNRHVRTGEDGFKILAPVTGPACPDCGNSPSYHDNEWIDCDRAGESPDEWDFDPSEEWSEGVYYFRTTTTFAFEQTEPLDDADPDDVFTPPEETHVGEFGDEDHAATIRDALVTVTEDNTIPSLNTSVTVRIESPETATEYMAEGVSKDGEIHVTPDESNAAELKTVAHEVAHEILHHNNDNPLSSQAREIEAETIAFTVCKYFNINTEDYSSLYLSHWAQAARDSVTLGEDDDTTEDEKAREIVEDRLNVIQQTAADIIETIETELND